MCWKIRGRNKMTVLVTQKEEMYSSVLMSMGSPSFSFASSCGAVVVLSRPSSATVKVSFSLAFHCSACMSPLKESCYTFP